MTFEKNSLLKFFAALTAFILSNNINATVLEVGPQKAYATPCQAVARAFAGDIIEIDASGSPSYIGDVCYIGQNNLTLRGVNGRPSINANGKNAMGKATWVIGGSNVIVDNVELSGSTVPDGNGAGIRYEGTNLTIRNSYFHNNQDGILTGAGPTTEILIENSEFANNGSSVGPGHNIYIGNIKKFTLRSSYSHDAIVGHLVKSRAQENYILYNRLSATKGGDVSYEINLPNAGTSYVIGNIIHQPLVNGNSSLLSYGEEGSTNTNNKIYVINNTFINDSGSGTFVNLAMGTVGLVQNNIFAGSGTPVSGASAASATISNNYQNPAPLFADRTNFDFHPTANSPFINMGINPGTDPSGYSLTPTLQYVHVAKSEPRPVVGAIDIGAYEYNGVATAPTPTQTPTPVPTITVTPLPTPSTPSGDNMAPAIVITYPANNATVLRGSVVQFVAAATDNISVKKVQFYVDGKLICTDISPYYNCKFRVANRRNVTYQIQANALDAANNIGYSKIIKIKTSY